MLPDDVEWHRAQPEPERLEQDERFRQLWRSVSGPHAELTGPLIRFAAAIEEQQRSDLNWIRAQRDTAEEKLADGREQQRDAAHAALTKLTAHCCCHEPQGWPCERPACVGAIARAALAASAPQNGKQG